MEKCENHHYTRHCYHCKCTIEKVNPMSLPGGTGEGGQVGGGVHRVTLDHAPVVHRLHGAIPRINLYPVDSVISSPNTYPLDGDLSGG